MKKAGNLCINPIRNGIEHKRLLISLLEYNNIVSVRRKVCCKSYCKVVDLSLTIS